MSTYDGTQKANSGCAQNIPYHIFRTSYVDNLRQDALAMASSEAIAFCDVDNFSGPEIECDASTLTEDEWQKRRAHTIGGSDCAAIFGENRYKEFEQQNPATEGLPNICGYMGRACRQMEKEEGANRANCTTCPLAQFARMKELYRVLDEWSDAYYNNDAPLVTDEEYDRHMQELKRLESAHPECAACRCVPKRLFSRF